ncbi:MAG TPA: ABC transporter permease [Acidimicrobiales bacterium]|nr:ABC transporter permease [Acidimicrobiales bacterium]
MAWYHLLLITRSPIGTFISLVIPVMLLVALYLVTPEMTLQSLGGVHIAQFLTPSMASFAVLNVGFVDVVISVTLARDEGILRRLHTSPAPPWAYFAGRLATAVIVAAGAVTIVCGVGVLFLHVHLPLSSIPMLAAAAAAGLATSFALGIAVSTLVPEAVGALPIAYGVLLPVAFVSQVFFPAPSEAPWLRDLAAAFPVLPFVRGMQAAFLVSSQPLDAHGLLIMGGWTGAALLVALFFFSWEPGTRRRRHLRPRSRSR